MTDRSHYVTRKRTLAEEGREEPSELSPSARVLLVWELTKQAWTFKEGSWRESRLPRHVVRVVREAC